MDVDDLPGEVAAQLVRQDLHVPGEDDQLDVELGDQLPQAVLRGRLRVLRDRHVVERLAVERGHVRQVGVVADNADDVDRHALIALAVQQVHQAVRRLADQHQRAQAAADDVDLPGHAEPFRHRSERRGEGLASGRLLDVERHLHAHEEQARRRVPELLRLGDVAAVLGQHARDGVHDPGAVGAGEGQHPFGRHPPIVTDPARRATPRPSSGGNRFLLADTVTGP